MKAHFVLRALCALTVAFLLLSAVPPASQRPESDLPPRMRYLENLRVKPSSGVLPKSHVGLQPLAPDDLGLWSKIAYDAWQGDNMEIFLMNGDLSNLQQVTTTSSVYEGQPRLNRGCAGIAFLYDDGVTDTEIYTMNANGSSRVNRTNNSNNDWFPFWNPAGDRIVYQSYNGTQTDVYRMNSDGSNKVNLSNNSAWDGMPSYSPDGASIVFASNRGGNDCLYTMDINGNNQTPLICQDLIEDPVYSPDGLQIAFDSDANFDGYTELWVMNSNGTNAHQVYDPPGSQTDAWATSWSPDGRYIAFTQATWEYDPGEDDWYVSTAYAAAWDSVSGNASLLVTSGYAYDFEPDWHSCDISAPTTSVAALPTWSPANFNTSWSGTDTGGSELKNYDVQVRDGGGVWTDWQLATTATSAPYSGLHMHTYYFRSRGRDNANNLEAYPTDPDASTFVDAQAPDTQVSALPLYSPGTFNVVWGGSDSGAGIATYDVQVRDGATGTWTDWLVGVTGTTLGYSGVTGHTYYFRSRGTDAVGNVEAYPADYDAFTSVDTQPPYSVVQELLPFTRSTAGVNWSGVDPGGAGILNYDIQTRDGAAGTWADWQLATAATGAGFNGTPGHTMYFRSRARDGVGNLEAYPGGDGDAQTTFYAWMAEGMVMDNSGTPAGGATVTGAPGVFLAEPTDMWGGYALYSAVTPVDPRQVQVSKAGYGALPAALLDGNDDVTFDAILPPADNLIADPGFETGAFTWQTGGALPPSIGSMGHTGFYGAALGSGSSIPGTPGEDVYTVITQTLTLPPEMTSPFLSFFYDLNGASAAENTGLRVRVQRGTIIEDLLDTTTDTDGWQPAVYDLGDWEGQAITLTFRVRNEAGLAGALALVDEVNIGGAKPDLWIEAWSDVDFAMPGETVVQTITYGNQGGASTSGTVITYTLPAELEFASATVPPAVTPSGLVWDLVGLAGGGGPFEIEVTCTVGAGATPFNVYESQAQIAAGAADTELEALNNKWRVRVQVGRMLLLPLMWRR